MNVKRDNVRVIRMISDLHGVIAGSRRVAEGGLRTELVRDRV